MTVSLTPETLADDQLRIEVPFDTSDLSEDRVFDAEPGLTEELNNSQDYNPQESWPGCFQSLHY